MHEMSLALSILEIVSHEIQTRFGERAADGRCDSVGVRVGRLSSVEPEALEFAWEVARRDSPFPQARLEIDSVPAKGRCDVCGGEFDLEVGTGQCARCGMAPFRVFQGEEIEVSRIVWCEREGEEGTIRETPLVRPG
jgi:hydrogenase nickel incorporation protein HypA/HybF